ncbi:MAG: DUF922 domain-containing protein [Flavobacteriaceae bacterium]|nr:DUF922 domain-containing protein [Flavobacteriaceae bacterium]
MIRYYILLLLGIVALSSFKPGLATDTEKMVWKEDRKLSWRDFKATPQPVSGYVASTHSGISFSYSLRGNGNSVSVDYTVTSNFYPNLSWYQRKQVNAFILAHEQTHFDISELHARILRKKMSEFHFKLDSKEAIETMYAEVEAQRRVFQQRYDLETDHSRNEQAELNWRAEVANQLRQYERWK